MIVKAIVYGPFGTYHEPIKEKCHDFTFDDTDVSFDDDKSLYIIIYESELRVIAGISAQWNKRGLETGSELFGLWTHGQRPFILMVSGPGPDAVHQPAYFSQDIDFFHKTNRTIASNYGLQPNGMEHHHTIDLSSPSGTDVSQVKSITKRNNFTRWIDIITTSEDNSHLSGRFSNSLSYTQESLKLPDIRISAFLYTNPNAGEKAEVPIRVIKGISPFRQQALSDGLLSPEDIGEYASDFPMEKIIYKPFDFEKKYADQQIPDKITDQCGELPEDIQSDINFYLKKDSVTVTLPLPDERTACVTYSDKPPYQIESVCVKENDKEDSEDMTQALFSDKRNATLKQIYELLLKGGAPDVEEILSEGIEQNDEGPKDLFERIRQFPENLRKVIRCIIKSDHVVVTIPLPNDGIAFISCNDKPPHLVKKICIKNDSSDSTKKAIKKMFADKYDLSLKQAYEMLLETLNKGGDNHENLRTV